MIILKKENEPSRELAHQMQINVEFKIHSAFVILFVLHHSVSPENIGQSNGGAFLVNVTDLITIYIVTPFNSIMNSYIEFL